ncbi:proline-rich spliceosome-associated (PSP) family protein [Raphanus sativus]|nr:proline-rich spliceosome-associated (PSP) family protein [Raphanus sativus]
MTAETATAAHGNIDLPNGDASNGNITASSKKSRESDRRRRRRKQKKNRKAASHADASDSKENADPQQQDSEQIVIEYVPEQAEFGDGFSDDFKEIFEKFSFREPVASEVTTLRRTESEENKDVKKKVNSDSEADEEDQGNDQKEKGISNKQKKLGRSMKIAELKQVSARPDVVEVWDATSADPKLLVFLKSYRNTVPVPRGERL